MRDYQVVDLNGLRKEKQEIAEHTLHSLYEKYFSYLEMNTNLREKVRAKHLFNHIVGVPFEELEQHEWKVQFEHWFAFDYVNVMGSRMFDSFIRQHSAELTKSMLEISSFLFLMVIEPVVIKEISHKREIVGMTPFEKKTIPIQSLFFPFYELNEGDMIFVRLTRAGFKHVAIGPYVKVNGCQVEAVLKDLEADFEAAKRRQVHTSWRSFLKEYGVKYLKFANSL